MGAVERVAHSDDEWQNAEPPAAGSDAYTPAAGAQAMDRAVSALEGLRGAERELDAALLDAARWALEGTQAHLLVLATATLQDLRRDLGRTEAWLARQIGTDDTAAREGVLADGRTYAVQKGADRKAWDHATWQRDVRVQVLSGVPSLVVDPATGEQVPVAELLAAVQAVHGASAPKVTALNALGLQAADYCEQVPGSWSVRVSAPGD